MALKKFGDGTYIFGFGDGSAAAIKAAVGLTPQKLTISGEPEFVAEAQDEEGYTAALAVADDKQTFTVEGFITNLAAYNATGANFAFDGKFFIVTGRNKDMEPRMYQKGTLTGVCYTKITAEVP